MTNPTKALDIEARELLARQLEVGLYHDDAERIKVAQDGLGVICAASAIAAISELLNRLREVECATQVTHEECKTEIQRLEHDLTTSQVLLEECREVLGPIFKHMTERWEGVGDGRGVYFCIDPWEAVPWIPIADLRRAASLIEKLEGK